MELYQRFLTEKVDENGRLTGIDFHAPDDFNFGFDVVDYYGTEEPERRAMIWVSSEEEERIFTFGDMMRKSAQAANYFRSLGIGKGDRVLLVLRRHWEFWPIIVALHKIGAISIPATDQLKEKDFVYRFDAAGVKAIICTTTGNVIEEAESAVKKCPQVTVMVSAVGRREGWHFFNAECEAFDEAYPRPTDGTAPMRDELMLMYFTSGTTAYPKIAAHEHTYALAHFVTAKWWHNVRKDGIHFTVAETGWGKAVWGKLYGQWLCGACVFTYDFEKFDQEKLLATIRSLHSVAIDVDAIAKQVASPRAANIVLLGAASPFLGIDVDKIEEGIRNIFERKGEAIVEMNLKAFRAGLEYARQSIKQ